MAEALQEIPGAANLTLDFYDRSRIATWVRLREFCREANLRMEIREAETRDDAVGCFDTPYHIFDSPDDRDYARHMAFEIGLATLADQAAWSEQKRQQRALGYGNSAQLIVFPYNTPTCTLTLLWKAGTYGGSAWVPLFERR